MEKIKEYYKNHKLLVIFLSIVFLIYLDFLLFGRDGVIGYILRGLDGSRTGLGMLLLYGIMLTPPLLIVAGLWLGGNFIRKKTIKNSQDHVDVIVADPKPLEPLKLFFPYSNKTLLFILMIIIISIIYTYLVFN